jgi:hypothetical protein
MWSVSSFLSVSPYSPCLCRAGASTGRQFSLPALPADHPDPGQRRRRGCRSGCRCGSRSGTAAAARRAGLRTGPRSVPRGCRNRDGRHRRSRLPAASGRCAARCGCVRRRPSCPGGSDLVSRPHDGACPHPHPFRRSGRGARPRKSSHVATNRWLALRPVPAARPPAHKKSLRVSGTGPRCRCSIWGGNGRPGHLTPAAMKFRKKYPPC